MPEDMRLAKAIYRWVAKVIKYDYDSIKKDKNGQETFRKPQDPLFVFDQGIGVCAGKANLVNLMMRMAGIPSAIITSKDHVFNAVYLKDIANNRKGWTLIDATWGAPESDMEMRAGKKPEIKTIKDILEISFKKFVLTGFEQLNKDFIDRINNVNKLQDRSKLKDSREYTQAFQTLCENLFKQYKDELKNNINIMKNNKKNNASYLEKTNARKAEDRIKDIVDDMNKKIKSEISRLNLQYKDIAKFRSFKIVFLNYNVTEELSQTLSVDMKVDLPLKEAKKIEEKFNYWSDERKVFFPGFYDKTLSFKGANEDIINWDSHKIEEIVFGNWFDESEKNSVFNLKIDGVTYKILENKEGKCDGIELTGDYGRRLENVKISPDMANLGMPFKIRYGIKSLILQGNEEFLGRLSHSDVESINADKSTRYVADKIALYKRKKDGSKGNIESIFKSMGEFNGVNFVINTDNEGKKIDSIKIFCYRNQVKDVKLPEYLTQFNLPIKIGFGIESLVLKNDDVVDFSQARSLKSVDVTDSNKYMAEDGILYEKNNGRKGNKIIVANKISVID